MLYVFIFVLFIFFFFFFSSRRRHTRWPRDWSSDVCSSDLERFPQTPGLVINEILKKTGKTADDIDLFEVNEAFAAVALASNKIAGLDPEKVNVNGGAVALGHPIGASGARIILTLAYELKRRGGGIGIAAICSGSGQGDAIMIEVPGK